MPHIVLPTPPLVSVVLATYNRRELLRASLRSVLDQTYRHLEVIVVDDGSTDGTEELIAELADSRIRYYRQPQNAGRSRARNRALSLVQGDFVAFQDSDDLFDLDKIETQLKIFAENPQIGMVYTAGRVIDEQGRPIPADFRAPASGNIYPAIAFYLPVIVLLPSVLLRRQVVDQVGGFDESLHRFEDTDFWRRVAKITPAVGYDHETITIRTHSGNQMENPREVLASLDYYIQKVFREDSAARTFWGRRRAADLYLHYGYAVYVHPQYQDYSRDFFKRALSYWPFQFAWAVQLARIFYPPATRPLWMKMVGRFCLRPFLTVTQFLLEIKKGKNQRG